MPRRSVIVRRRLYLLAGWLAIMSIVSGQPQAAGPQAPTSGPAASPNPLSGLVNRYCVTCHNEKLRTGGLVLDKLDATRVSEGAETWEKVVKKLRGGLMPPTGAPRPDKATYDAVVSWLVTEIDRSAASKPNPGRTETFHRLNRSEYQNAVRDLLALDVDVASLLPTDDTDRHGFDNTAAVLSVSPTLLDRYLSAARKLSRLAVGGAAGPAIDTYDVPRMLYQDDRLSEDLPFGSRGGIAVHHTFPVDGEYEIKIRLQRNYVDYIRGMGSPHLLDVRLNGALIKQFSVGGEATGRPGPESFGGNVFGDPAWEKYMLTADEGLNVRFAARAGTHTVGVSFARKLSLTEGVRQPRQMGFALAINEWYDGNAAVETVEIGGPYQVAGPGDTPSRARIFDCRPRSRAEEDSCARKILSRLARRAYRRPVTGDDVQTLVAFYKTGRNGKDGSFDAGIQFALERILASPDFLFRIARDPQNVAPGTPYRISDLDLASRLSFFLWSSIPDEELLDTAIRGKLKDPAVLARQVRRMLADSRSKALVDNFASQWLELRSLRDVTPDPVVYPDFDENLRAAFQQETELFVGSQIRDDRSIYELLDADYTFLNERLARHYQIPGVSGERFRRVQLADGRRGGLLGHGSILAVTSYPTRTSPVIRGKWLLTNILGTPPPTPPPNVPGLPDRGEGGKPASVRERLERHRRNPVCATCHSQMDPLGFALENFDAIGAWRTTDDGHTPVDASGALPGGSKFDGLTGLRTVLRGRREQFVETVAEKLLAYSLGRAVQHYDMPVIRAIMHETAPSDYKWSAIILGIVKSAPFQMRSSQVEDTPAAATSRGAPSR